MNLLPPPSKPIQYFRSHKRALKQSLKMPFAEPIRFLLTLLSLSMCFYIPLLLWTLWMNYQELENSWQDQGSIVVFLKTNNQQNTSLRDQIESLDWVESAKIVNQELIYKQVANNNQLSQVYELIEKQELPTQLQIKANSDLEVSVIEKFITEYSENPEVEYISYDKQWLSQLSTITMVLKYLSQLSIIVFFLIIMVFITHTISSEINKHRDEIKLLDLIGSSWPQTRRKYLYYGIMLGLLSGVLALIMMYLSLLFLEAPLEKLNSTFISSMKLEMISWWHTLQVLAVAIFVTWVATRLSLSTQKHRI